MDVDDIIVAGAIATTYGSRAVLPVALTVLLFYVCELLFKNYTAPDRLARIAVLLNSVLGTSLLTILLFHEVQGRLLTVALE